MFLFFARRILLFAAVFAFGALATCVAHESNAPASTAAQVTTLTGIDVLEAENFAPLDGKRVGLITNQTGVDSAGQRTIDLLAHAKGVKLVALFSPEHGIRGRMDASVPNSSSTFRTRGCASTPSSPRWRTAWKPPRNSTSRTSFWTGPTRSAEKSSKGRCSIAASCRLSAISPCPCVTP